MVRKSYFFVLLLSLFLALCDCVNVFAQVEYEIADMGAYSSGMGINNKGQVAGYFGADSPYPAYWDPEIGLKYLTGPEHGIAQSINDNGIIAGWVQGANRYGVYWDLDKNYHFLPTGIPSLAYDINNSNEVVGVGIDPPYAVSWDMDNNALQFLGFSPVSYARSINEAGKIAGYTGGTGFLYDHGTITYLGSLGGAVNPYGINDNDQIVGADYSIGAFIWEDGSMKPLGKLAGWTLAFGINNSGQVVGRDYTANRAFIWNDDLGMRDLTALIDPELGWILDYAYDINELGQVTGFGYLNGAQHGYVLTPIVAPVPEPASLSLLGIGIAGILFRKRKK